MANFDVRIVGAVEGWLQSVITNKELRTREEGKDGTFADTSIADDDYCLVGVGVLGDPAYPVVDHILQFA